MLAAALNAAQDVVQMLGSAWSFGGMSAEELATSALAVHEFVRVHLDCNQLTWFSFEVEEQGDAKAATPAS